MKRIAAVLIGAATCVAVQAQQASAPHQQVLSAPGGRYVFGQISEYARHQFMLDTQTGRLWQIVCAKREAQAAAGEERKCTLTVLDAVPYSDDSGALSATPPIGKR